MKKKVDLLAVALNGWGGHCWGRGQGRGQGGALGNSPQARGPQGSEPLKKNQCAFCRQEGHWRNERPQLQPRRREAKEKEDFVGLAGIEWDDD
jgi:hypothetical protein